VRDDRRRQVGVTVQVERVAATEHDRVEQDAAL
jgi:hypothetical protein